MVNIMQEYQEFCSSQGIEFKYHSTVNPYDDTTLFCPSGMQQFKSKFRDLTYTGTISNLQSCVRTNDIEEIDDGIHMELILN